MKLLRRSYAAGLALLAAVGFAAAPAKTQDLTPIRFTLDWKIQGPHSWYYLAKEKGYFKDEGLNVTIDQGEGSAAAITRVMSGAYDAGFGDINAVMQNAADRPGEQPIMVYLVYNGAPNVLVVKADGPIKTLNDVEGKIVSAPAGSATLRLFVPLAKKNGVDPSKVKILNAAPNLIEQLLVQGQADAIAQFSNTSYMNFLAMKLNPEKDFRWFFYSQHGLDLYSNGVIVSQKLLKENPKAVRGLVRAINRAIIETLANPDPAIDLIHKVEPLTNKELEKQRMLYTAKSLMVTPETKAIGLGDLDDKRLAASIATVAEAYGLKRTPDVREIFDRSFLPSREEREIKMKD